MRLFELFEHKNQASDLLDEWDRFDKLNNPENYTFKKKESDRYKDIEDNGGTPVLSRPEEVSKEDIWDTQPKHSNDDLMTSPGYIGRENAKRRSGHEYDNKAPQSEPYANPAIPGAEKRLIKDAEHRLGRHLTKN